MSAPVPSVEPPRDRAPRYVTVALLLGIAAAPLPARAWEFVNVVDSTGPYFEFTPPGINDSGVVAFRAKLDAGGQAIVAGDAAGLDEIATTAGPFSVFLTQVSISDLGTVLFNAELDAFGTGVFVGPDPVNDAIANTNDEFLFVNLGAIDAFDDVVLSAGIGATRGIYRGTDALVDNLDAFDFFDSPAINDTGTIAFRASFDGGGAGIHTVPLAGGEAILIVDTSGPFSTFDETVAINDAGEVVFQATLDANGASGIFVGPDPATDTVVDTTGPFDLLDEPAITENGSVYFWGATATGGGIYGGPDPVADEVIGSLDPLFGSQVANVNMRSEGYANGRIGFSYTLIDGRSGVAIAFAPEPSALLGTSATCLVLCALRARWRVA